MGDPLMNSFSHLTSEYLNKCKKVDDNKYLFPFFKVKIRNKYREEYKNTSTSIYSYV